MKGNRKQNPPEEIWLSVNAPGKEPTVKYIRADTITIYVKALREAASTISGLLTVIAEYERRGLIDGSADPDTLVARGRRIIEEYSDEEADA